MSTPMTPPPRRMIGPDGISYDVPPDQVDQLPAGFRDETPQDVQAAKDQETYGGVAGGIVAAGAGVMESIPYIGGTLSKIALGDASKSKTAHPLLHGAGMFAGSTAGVAATGGLGEAIGIGGEAMEGSSLLTRAAVRGAVGAAEGGAIWGPGYAVNDAVLNDHPLTSEYLLAAAGGGALLGGILGGGLSIGGDLASKGLEKIGNSVRASTLAKLVDSDARALEDAGLTTSKINDLFRDGTIKSGDTPVAVQSRLADKVGQLGQQVSEIGQRIDASGQTFDLPQILKSAKADTFNNILQLGDDAAGFQRVNAVRSSLMAQEGEGAATLAGALDAAIGEKAGAIEGPLRTRAKDLLEEHASLTSLQRMADEAVANGKQAVAGAAEKGGAFGALMRQGEHLATWGMLGHFASSILGGHAGLGLFLAESGGNVLRDILEDPAAIGEKFVNASNGIAKTIGLTNGRLEAAIGSAVREAGSTGARAGGSVAQELASRLFLPVNATAGDVEGLRQRLKDTAPPMPNGNPTLNQAVLRQRAVLAQALPLTPPPTLPESLARRGDPSAKQLANYNQTVAALVDPIGKIAGVGHGATTATHLQAIRAAYPQLASKAAAALINRSAQSGKTAHIALRRSIEILSGRPMDPALAPAKVARIQAVFQSPQPPGRGGASPGGQSVKLNQKGLANMDLAGRLNSLSQPEGKG